MVDSFYRLRGLTVEIQNDNLRGMVESFLDKPGFSEVSGGVAHHGYKGGLSDHTLEVVNISLGIYLTCGVKELLSKDFLVAGAMLHDIGKAYMDYDEYRHAGAAHSAVGAYIVSEACKTRGIAEELRKHLMALIIEHCKFGFTSDVKFSTREAYIVYTADTLSAGICAKDASREFATKIWDEVQTVNV